MKWQGAPLLLLGVSLGAQTLPEFATENLSGKAVELPAAASGRAAVLVVGFTKSSQNQTKPWSMRLNREFPDPKKVVVYSIAALESVPRLVRGMVVRGIRSGIPEGQRDRFLLLYRKEEELKRVSGFSTADDAYVLLLDAEGRILWRAQGAISDAGVAGLVQHLPRPGAK